MLGIFKGTKPDITPAQVIGLLIAGVPVAAKLGAAFAIFTLTAVQQAALNEALQWAAVVAGALFLSDAGLRAARNGAAAKRDAAALLAPAAPATASVGAKGAAGYDAPLHPGRSSWGAHEPPAEAAEPPDLTPVAAVASPVEAADGPLEAVDAEGEGLIDDQTEFDSPPPPIGVPADPDGPR